MFPAKLFPGDRRLWLCAAVVLILGAIGVALSLLVPRDFYTGTNSVRTRGFLTELEKGDRLCVRDLEVPAGTARVRMEVETPGAPQPPLIANLASGDGRQFARAAIPGGPAGRRKVDFAIPERARTARSTLCVRSAGNVSFGGVIGTGDALPLLLNGKEIGNQVAIWFLPPPGEKRSLLAQSDEILERVALLRPAWVGPWTYVVLLLGVMPLLAYASVRLLATAADARARSLAVGIALLAVANAWVWALITTPFNAPDESEHYAYVQYFAETGGATQRERAAPPLQPVYSADQTLALEAARIHWWNEAGDGRPPWTPRAEDRWRERRAVQGEPRRENGGGPTPATWAHSPLYYATLAPAYLAASGGSTWDQLTAARFLSALYAAIVAVCAFLLVHDLLPRHNVVGAAAGVLVAFHPMFSFLGGAVNNDMGVNAAAAVVILLAVRGLHRGLTVGSGIALGMTVALMPIIKGTGYALYPLLLLAGGALLVKRHSRRDLLAYAAAVAGFAAVLVIWSAVSSTFDQSTVTTPGGTAPANTALSNPGGYLSYLWQVFLPPLPFMTDLFIFDWPFFNIYIERGWGAFGWYAVFFPRWVYGLILFVMAAIGALGARVAWRNGDWVRRHWLPVAFVVLVPATVIAAVEAAYYSPSPRPVLAEFGRYLFPAITCLAAIAASACLGLGRRWAPVAATALAMGVVVLSYASQLLTLAGFYT